MPDLTKSCMLTEEEINRLLTWHGDKLGYPAANIDFEIERINYLNKRLKAFKEPEATTITGTEIKEKQATGWGT